VGRLLHVAVAFWFVAGLLGRNITMARAKAATDLRTLQELVDLSGRFERMIVIPGSFAVLVARFARGVGAGSAARRGRPLVAGHVVDPIRHRRRARADGVPSARQISESVLEDAKQRGEVTPELRTAPRDPAVRNARATELVVTTSS